MGKMCQEWAGAGVDWKRCQTTRESTTVLPRAPLAILMSGKRARAGQGELRWIYEVNGAGRNHENEVATFDDSRLP